MVGANMGAGQRRRAVHTAWIAAVIGGAIAGSVGVLGALFAPQWMSFFTADPAIKAVGTSYLMINGPVYALMGAGSALFFASQGLGNVVWPFLAVEFPACRSDRRRLAGDARVRPWHARHVHCQCSVDRLGGTCDHPGVLAAQQACVEGGAVVICVVLRMQGSHTLRINDERRPFALRAIPTSRRMGPCFSPGQHRPTTSAPASPRTAACSRP